MKKIIKTLLVVMVLAVVLTAFTGCDAVETLKGIIPPAIAEKIPTQLTCSILGHKGEAYSPCERCGEIWTESVQGSLECNSVGHNMKAFEEVPATCTEDGWSAGVVCTRCGYAERTRFPIPAKGHSMLDATCENPSTCSVCGHTEGEAAGHKPVDVEALAPTCSAVGHTAGTKCSVCKEVLSGCEEIAIDPTAHKAVDVEALAPTCSTPGHTAGTACELCDEILSGCEEIAIDPDAHYFVSGLCGICQKVFEHGVGDNTRVALETLGVADDGSLYEFIYFYIPEAGHYKLTGENVVLSVFKLTDAGVDWASGVFTEGVFTEGLYVVGLNYYAGAGEYSFNVSISHTYTDGYCSCGAVDPDYYFPVTIPQALEAAEGWNVELTGTVVGIYQAYNSQYNNTSVYVADEAGNQILLFRLPGNWSLGDKLTVKGTISIYKGTAQVAAGAEVVEYTDVTRVYLSDVKNWTAAYCYTATENWTHEAAWPGNAMTYDADLGLWYYDIPAGNYWVIFNNGNGAQTGNLVVSESSDLVFNNADTYTVAGVTELCGSSWKETDTANDMTYDAETGTYTKIYTNVAAGSYEFKCVQNHSWTVAYPSSNYWFSVDVDGSTVIITLNGTTVTVEVIAPATEETTVSVSIADYADANSWANGTMYNTIVMDDVVTVTAAGGSNTGKYYTDGEAWRIYATDSPAGTVTISLAAGHELVSIKITTATGTYAYLYVDGTTTDISNVETSVSGSSVLLNSVKNGSNGKQVRITAIEVIYK